jgi:hypothetical protein
MKTACGTAIDLPSRLDPEVNAVVCRAKACPDCAAENRHLWPMASAEDHRLLRMRVYRRRRADVAAGGLAVECRRAAAGAATVSKGSRAMRYKHEQAC